MPQTLTLDSVISMGRTGDARQFIDVASAALAQGIRNDDLWLLLVQRLAEKGLLQRARALAEGLPEELRDRPELIPLLCSRVTDGKDGRVPWHPLAKTYEANLTVLRRHYDWADQIAEVWKAERRFLELHRTNDGDWQVFDRREDAGGGWRLGFGSHKPQPPADELAKQLSGKVLPPLVLEWVGLGCHLPWLYAATANTFLGASARIYQIEPALPALAVALHLNDWTVELSDDRVRLCCGADAYNEFERQILSDESRMVPSVVIQASPWDARVGGEAQTRIDALKRRVEAERVTLQQSVGARYRGRDRAWWRRRYAEALNGAGPQLRVLGITCRFTTVLQYAMRDLMNALRANGCDTRVLIEPDNHARVSSIQKLAAIRDFQPDLILLIDHTRLGQRAGVIDDVPVATWVQDRLPWLFDDAVGESMGPLDFCFGFNRAELVQQHGYPAEQFMECEMATNPAFLAGQAEERETAPQSLTGFQEDPDLRCEVAFATNRGRSTELICEQCSTRSSPAFRRFIRACHEELVARTRQSLLNGGLFAEDFVRGMERAVGLELPAETRNAVVQELIHPLVDVLLRQQTIDWAAQWAAETGRRFHLYGNGWGADPRYAAHARGFVAHGPELGRVFRAARVNLHAGRNHALHQRVLDGLSAGGFFLIRRHANDIWYRFKRAVFAVVRSRGLRAGDTICARDLPAPLRGEWATFRQMHGVAPDEPYVVTAGLIDSIENYAGAELRPVPMTVWPEFARVTFATRAELYERLDFFLTNEQERRELARTMRTSVLEHFSYEALAKRLLKWMLDVLGRPVSGRPHAEHVLHNGRSSC